MGEVRVVRNGNRFLFEGMDVSDPTLTPAEKARLQATGAIERYGWRVVDAKVDPVKVQGEGVQNG